MIKIIGHSGAEGTGQNSLAYLEEISKAKIDGFEVDVRIFDQDLYLSHDKLFGKKALEFSRVFEVLEQRKDLIVNCDIKEKSATKKVYESFLEKDLLGYLMMTGDVDFSYMKNQEKVKLFSNSELLIEDSNKKDFFKEHKIEDLIDKFNAYKEEYKLFGLCINYEAFDKESFEILLKANFPLSIWTVDDDTYLRKILSYKTESTIYLTSNKIKKAREILSNL